MSQARNAKKIGPFTQIAYSTDDGLTWNASRPAYDLPSPIDGVEASLVVHPGPPLKLFHSAPDSFLLRTDMVVMVSEDDGRSWREHKRVWKGAAGYSAMVVLGGNSSHGAPATAPLGLLFDRNNERPCSSLRLEACLSHKCQWCQNADALRFKKCRHWFTSTLRHDDYQGTSTTLDCCSVHNFASILSAL